ncbi:MAG: hypothetical protein GQ570_10590 [Helicobacteraceae bacterium]|nr:hypothetical protein [Helicobacteraceae bacterium]
MRESNWLRPWNEHNLKILDFVEYSVKDETIFLQKIKSALKSREFTLEDNEFIGSLLNDEKLQFFVVSHINSSNLNGFTLSLGRETSQKKFDRIDIILEEKSNRLDSITLFINPYDVYTKNEFTMLSPKTTPQMQELYDYKNTLEGDI